MELALRRLGFGRAEIERMPKAVAESFIRAYANPWKPGKKGKKFKVKRG